MTDEERANIENKALEEEYNTLENSVEDVIVTPVEEVEEIENIEDIENAESREVG